MSSIISSLSTIKNFIGNTGRNECNEYLYDALKVAIECMEKQIPKKVRWTDAYQSYTSAGDEAESYCPCCDMQVNEDDNRYCSNCGQLMAYHSEDLIVGDSHD